VDLDLSIVTLLKGASPVVKGVMGLLLLASMASWTMIFKKWFLLKHAIKQADEFEDKFWSGGDLNQLYNNVTTGKKSLAGMAKIFEAGFKEYARLRKQSSDPSAILQGAQRSMRVTLARETDYLETNLPFLATVGSTSPYVGLFGTVWGIMNAFRSLGNVKQATLAMVAPGIAEALIATAMGLFAAIPAVIAYNRYAADLDRLINRYDAFIEEFSSILHRQVHK